MSQRFNNILDTSNAIDIEASYREMLRECYQECLTGPFEYMDPADVLETMDPTAFRCGCNDWADAQDWEEYNGDWYAISYLEDCREEADYEINAEIDQIEADLDEYDADGVDEETAEQHRETVEAEIRALRDQIIMLYKLF